MPVLPEIREAIAKREGVIPMEVAHRAFIQTSEGLKIEKDQLELLFWEVNHEEVNRERIENYCRLSSPLELAVGANMCKAITYRDNANTYEKIIEGKKFCDHFAHEILVHPDVSTGSACSMHDMATGIYRILDSRMNHILNNHIQQMEG